jgi:hypothetical protein
MNKLTVAALATLVGYIAGVAGPVMAQGAVRAAIDVPLLWKKQDTSAFYGANVYAAPMLGRDEIVRDALSWQLVRRGPAGRLVTCMVELPVGSEPLRLKLHDASGMYILTAGGVPAMTFSAPAPSASAVRGGSERSSAPH